MRRKLSALFSPKSEKTAICEDRDRRERESEKRCLPSNLHLRSTAHLHISRSPEMPATLSQSVPKAPKGLVACITHLISGATIFCKVPSFPFPPLFPGEIFPSAVCKTPNEIPFCSLIQNCFNFLRFKKRTGPAPIWSSSAYSLSQGISERNKGISKN